MGGLDADLSVFCVALLLVDLLVFVVYWLFVVVMDLVWCCFSSANIVIVWFTCGRLFCIRLLDVWFGFWLPVKLFVFVC